MVSKGKLAVAVAIFALAVSGRGWSQDPGQQPAQPPSQQPAQEPAKQTPAGAAPVADAGQQAADAQAAPVAGAANHTTWTKKGKTPYTGPTQVVEQTPT